MLIYNIIIIIIIIIVTAIVVFVVVYFLYIFLEHCQPKYNSTAKYILTTLILILQIHILCYSLFIIKIRHITVNQTMDRKLIILKPPFRNGLSAFIQQTALQ